MIQINPLQSYIDGGARAAITTPPSASLVFDLPGKAIWVKGVKLKGTDHTYTFNHDNYITLTNTPDQNNPELEDIKIGININTLKSAIDTTYEVVTSTTNGLAPKFSNENKLVASAATTYHFLGWAGTTLKWYLAPWRNVRINAETTDCLGVNDTNPLIISAGNGINVTWDSTNKKIVITNSKPDVNHNTDSHVSQLSIDSNKDYPVILKYTDSTSNEVSAVRYSSTLLYNPYSKQLKINGNKVITTTDIYVGATESTNATVGLVPVATSALRNYFLKGDGTWTNIATTNTWRPIKIENTDALGSGTDTGTLSFAAGTGIILAWDNTNKKIIITNSSPDQNHNTDENIKQTPKTDNVNRPLMMINGSTSAGEQINTSMFSTGIYANASTKMITANGFIKAGSSNNYVLLGGGGHKAVSDFAISGHNHDGKYLRKDTNDSTPYQYNFTKIDDHAIKVGTVRGTAVGSQTGEYIHLYERVAIGSPSGWGSRPAPSYGLATYGGAWLATDTGNVTIGGTNQLSSSWGNFNLIVGNNTNKVVIGYLNSSTNGVVVGGHNNALSAWAPLNIAGTTLYFRINETIKAIIDSNGNVGIGTTSPAYKLHVNGTLGVTNITTFNINNQWLTPSILQIGRTDASKNASKAVIGVTDGNLHIDAYHNKELYLNYYNKGRIRFGYQSGSYYISEDGSYYNGTATRAEYPVGFTSRRTSDWSGVPGTFVTAWHVNNAEIMFKYNGSNLNVITDGRFYQGIDIYGASKRVLDEYDISNTTWGNADTIDGYHASWFKQSWTARIQGNSWSRLYLGTQSTLHHVSIFSIEGSIGCVVFSGTFLVQSNHPTNAQIICLANGNYTQPQMRVLVNSSGDVLVDMYWVGNDCNTGSSSQQMSVIVHCLPLKGGINQCTSFTNDSAIPSGYNVAHSYGLESNTSVFRRLKCTDNIYAPNFYSTSDIRFKNIEEELIVDVKQLSKLPLFNFTWNNGIDGKHSGTSAQEVIKILPNLVSGNETLTLNYAVLGTIAGITACKELVTLKSELLQLKEKVKLLEDKLHKYENTL